MTPELQYGFGFRHIQTILIFFGLSIAYALRVNISVGIVAMTNPDGNPDYEIFDWTDTKSLIISSFYWGYLINQIPGGQLSKKYGCKYLLLTGIGVSSILNLATPFLVHLGNWQAFVVIRFFEGISQGVIFPSVHTFLAHWAPTSERGRLGVFCYSGVFFGTAVMLATSGVIASSALGWPGIFYISGCVGTAWSILWYFVGASRPIDHRFISDDELLFIESSLDHVDESDDRHIPTPWLRILTSMPFLALLVCYAAEAWGFLVLLVEIPTYMDAILGLDINNNALLSSLPYFAMWILGYLFVFIADYIQSRKLMSIGASRKFFNTIGLCCPSVALLGMGFIGKEQITLAVVILTIAVGTNAAMTLGCCLNHLDLAPNHAGILMGLTNALSTSVDILSPIAVRVIVPDEHDQGRWQLVFVVTSAIFFVGNLIFIIFGSGNVQLWNYLPPRGLKNKNRFRRNSIFLETGNRSNF